MWSVSSVVSLHDLHVGDVPFDGLDGFQGVAQAGVASWPVGF